MTTQDWNEIHLSEELAVGISNNLLEEFLKGKR